MILTYELSDDPGQEHEVEVESLAEAYDRQQKIADCCVWWDVTDECGEVIASS